jgi:hypothetical protein
VSRPGLLRFARNDAFSRCAFCSRPEFCGKPLQERPPEHDPEKCSRFSDQIMLPKKGAERRKARGRFRGPADKRCRLFVAFVAARAPLGDALASRRSTAALAKGFRPWLSPVPRFMVADNRSAPRAASSWQTGVWPAGRVSEPPERSLRNRARAPLSLHLQDRIRNVPLRERDGLF